MSMVFRRSAGLVTRLVEGEAFVISRNGIECLSQTASIAWQLLEVPSSKSELLQSFTHLYPDVPKSRLSRDITQLLQLLVRKKLLREVSAPGGHTRGRHRSTAR